jgi:hypothetical protein
MAPHPPVTTAGLLEPGKKRPVIVAIDYDGKTYHVAKESATDFSDLAAQHQDTMIENKKLVTETLTQKRYFKENFDPANDPQAPVEAEVATAEPGIDEPLTPDQQKAKVSEAVTMLVGNNNPDSFTSSGAPKVQAIEDLCGFAITSVDRDDAWEAYQRILSEG